MWRTNEDFQNEELGWLMEDLIDVIEERERANRPLEVAIKSLQARVVETEQYSHL